MQLANALWELKRSALTGIMYLPPSITVCQHWCHDSDWNLDKVKQNVWNKAPNVHMCWIKASVKPKLLQSDTEHFLLYIFMLPF